MCIESYKKHILYSSIYISMVATSFSALRSCYAASSADSVAPSVFWSLVGGVASLCLKAECNYVHFRSTLPPGDSEDPLFGWHDQGDSRRAIRNKIGQSQKLHGSR